MKTDLGPVWRDACLRNRDAIPQLAWLSDLRDWALGILSDRGLPDSNQEEWRYTSLEDYFQRGESSLASNDSAGQPLLILPDGRAVLPTSADAALPAGVEVHSLRNLSPELRAQAARMLASTSPDTGISTLAALNLALLGDGLYLRCNPASTDTPPAVHLRLTGSGMVQPRLLIELAPGSRLNLLLEHQGPAGTLANVVTQISCGTGSQLELLRIQDLPADGLLTETTHIELGQDATLAVSSLDFGGQLVRQDLSVALSGPGATAAIHGAFLAGGHQHVDNHTTVNHRTPDTSSREIFHGLATGNGRGVFNGRIVVQPGAVRTVSALSSRNLLLTNTAEIDTKPELEIFTDDVRCSHGATTGQLDANALFYLRSRGLSPDEARQALITAFLHATLALIVSEDLRTSVATRLQARLTALDGAADR
jgi:Fe-S cluster assembly protein SufD